MKIVLLVLALIVFLGLIFAVGIMLLFLSLLKDSENEAEYLEIFTSDGHLREEIFPTQ